MPRFIIQLSFIVVEFLVLLRWKRYAILTFISTDLLVLANPLWL